MAKLTAKQRRALRNAPKRRRAGMARRMRAPDSAALRGIKQGAGKSVSKAFGGLAVKGYHPCMHDAFHLAHLPLPRPTGPYSVVRTTQQINTSYELQFFGPMYNHVDQTWDKQCGIGVVNIGKKPQDNNNNYGWVFDQFNSSWTGAQITPSAFSVQVMNPEALQTTTGIVYLGRIRTSWKLTDNLGTVYSQLANFLVSYNNPRLCAAAKLAFRGVQIDLVPFNMSDLANFQRYSGGSSTTYTATNDSADFAGFAPMFIYNPNKIQLNLLVCCEWRTRFDPSNPAQATHVQHQFAPESIWARALHGAEALGNGVIDIADRVAETGNAMFGAMGASYRVARGARAIANAPLALGF